MSTGIIEARSALYGARPLERRARPFEVRSLADGAVGLTGYASTYEPYEVRDWLGEYTETISRGAFAKALSERDDVRLLINHKGIPLARTKSGTMSLAEDEHGLRVDVPMLDMRSPDVQTLHSAMERGDVDQMSFSFQATRQEWNEDYTQRNVQEVKLFDVSVVTYPANDTTNAKLRSGALLTREEWEALAQQADEASERGWNPKTSDYTISQWKSACAYHPAHDSDSYDAYKLPFKDPDGTINKTGLVSAGKMINHVKGGDHGQLVAAAHKLIAAFHSEGMDVPANVQKLAGGGDESKSAEVDMLAVRRMAQLRLRARSL